MALSNNRRRAVEIEEELRRRKQMEQYRQNQRNLGLNDAIDVYNRARGTYNNVTGFGNRLQGWGNNLNNFGSRLGQVNNPRVAGMGSRVQQLGNKFNTWGSKFNALNGGSQAGANAFGQGGASALGQMGTMAGNSGGASSGILGNAIASQTAGSAGAGASGAGSGALGGAIAGQTAAGSAGAGTAAGSGALAGSIGSATGGTAAATGATAGGIGAGAGGAAAGGTAAAGAAGGATAAAGGAAMAVPVAGWIIAAAAAAKMIKDKIDQEHKKINAKAMNADSENMQKSAQANAQRVQDAQQMFAQSAEQDAQAMSNQANEQQAGVAGQLPDMSQYMSSDGLADDMNAQLEESKEPVQDGDNSALASSIMNGISGQPTGGAAPISNRIQIDDNTSIKSNTPINLPSITQQQPIISEPEPLSGSVVGGKIVYNNLPYEDLPHNTNTSTMIVPNNQQTGGAAPVQGSVSKNNLLESMKNGINAFRAGFDENRNTNFNMNNLTDKTYSINTPQTVYKPSEELVNYQNELRNQGLADEIIQGVAQGRNSGNKDIANWINSNPNALKPQQEVVNVPTRYKKNLMNRLGELAGTGGRVLSHPATQALLAGLAYGISDGDIWTGIKGGIDYGQNKAKSDYYYRKLTGKNSAPIFNNFGSQDYNAEVNQQYKDALLANTVERMKQQQANSDRSYDLNKQKFEEQKKQNEIKNGLTQQRIANQKANADRNYNYKVSKSNSKGSSKQKASSDNFVIMQSPDGRKFRIPESQIKRMKAAGGKIVA